MKNNMFCISKKLLFFFGLFLLILAVFLINSKIGSSRLGSSPKAFGECWVVLRDGKFYISKPEQCFGKIGGFVCGLPYLGGTTWLINRKTGLMTKTTSLKMCNDQIHNLFISHTIIPTIVPTRTPSPTLKQSPKSPANTPKIQTPVVKKQEDYVMSVTLNKVDDVNYDLIINQINFGKKTKSITKVIIAPLIAGDSSSTYSVNNKCMTIGGRIERMTLAKAIITIFPDRNKFNIIVAGVNSNGDNNYSFLNTTINYSVVGKSIGAVIAKTILDRGDGDTISINGCFTKI